MCPVPLFCILLTRTRTITKHAVAWVGSIGATRFTVPLGTWNFRNFYSNRNFCWIESGPRLTASSLLFYNTSWYFDTRRSKRIITRNLAIDFCRFPILVSWLASNSIEDVCYRLLKFNILRPQWPLMPTPVPLRRLIHQFWVWFSSIKICSISSVDETHYSYIIQSIQCRPKPDRTTSSNHAWLWESNRAWNVI